MFKGISLYFSLNFPFLLSGKSLSGGQVSQNVTMHDSRLPLQYKWALCSSVVLHSVDWY